MWEVLEAFLTNVSILLVWLILPTATAAWQCCFSRSKLHAESYAKVRQTVWTQKGEGLI